MKPVCALTGASGYVGSRIAAALATEFEVAPMGRFPGEGGIAWHLSPSQNITDELKARGVAVLVHSAWDFRHPDPKENWRWNVEGSRKLIDDAQKAGVQQLSGHEGQAAGRLELVHVARAIGIDAREQGHGAGPD